MPACWISGLTTIAKLVIPCSLVDRAERVEKGHADALLEHAAGELVGHLEIEGAGEHALGLDEVDESLQLRGDPIVGVQQSQHGVPEFSGGIRGVGHGLFRLGGARGGHVRSAWSRIHLSSRGRVVTNGSGDRCGEWTVGLDGLTGTR